jgi:hypothetical protein
VTSTILLGTTPVSPRALAHELQNQQGGAWIASGVTGRVALLTHSVTINDPSSPGVHGITEVSCYTPTVGTVIQGSTTVDGGAQTVWGIFCFNQVSDHTQVRFAWAYVLAPGAHSISVGLWIAAGSINFDANDGGTSSVWERV